MSPTEEYRRRIPSDTKQLLTNIDSGAWRQVEAESLSSWHSERVDVHGAALDCIGHIIQ